MNSQDVVLTLIREHIVDTLLGALFLFVGVSACLIAVLRHRRESILLVWFGLFIGFYGVRILAATAAVLDLFAGSPWPERLVTAVNYLLPVPAFLFWAERTRSHLRFAFQILAGAGLVVAIAGMGAYVVSGSVYAFMNWALFLAIGSMLMLGPLMLVPRFFRKYFAIQTTVLRIVLPVLTGLMVVTDIMYMVGHPPPHLLEPMGFAVFVFATGYEAAQYTFSNERRLLSIESELETARNIQSSILPNRVPSVPGLRIAASYNPMSAVAGDFYQFLQVEDQGIGVLVADVTGHGVPAALIASMIKVAMQSVVVVASEPERVLRELNRILTPELNGRLTSAAYLWIDVCTHTARYSAAGHPALLHWKKDGLELRKVECNGILFGVLADAAYPVESVALNTGDRFLIYTDGLIEPENGRGEAFGDGRLGEVMKESREDSAQEFIDHLLPALDAWRPSHAVQEDDTTVIVIDVVG